MKNEQDSKSPAIPPLPPATGSATAYDYELLEIVTKCQIGKMTCRRAVEEIQKHYSNPAPTPTHDESELPTLASFHGIITSEPGKSAEDMLEEERRGQWANDEQDQQ